MWRVSNQPKSKEESVNELRVLHRRVAELEALQPQLKQAEEELIRKEKLAVLGQLAGG